LRQVLALYGKYEQNFRKNGPKSRLIAKLDGKPVGSTGEFRNNVAAAGAGKSVRVDLLRDDKSQHVTVKLGELPSSGEASSSTTAPSRPGMVEGLSLSPLSPALRKRHDIGDQVKQGVVITGVARGSLGARAGLRPGDVVVEVNRRPVTSVESLRKAWDNAEGRVLLLVHRRGSTVYIVVKRRSE
jgi:serine protease Do